MISSLRREHEVRFSSSHASGRSNTAFIGLGKAVCSFYWVIGMAYLSILGYQPCLGMEELYLSMSICVFVRIICRGAFPLRCTGM